MDGLTHYFDKLKKKLFASELKIEDISAVLTEIIGVPVPKEKIKLNEREAELTLLVPSQIKSEIFIKKEKILAKLAEKGIIIKNIK